MRSPPNTKGKPRVFFPPLSFPQSHLVFPASPVHGPYMPQYMESPKRPQVSEVQRMHNALTHACFFVLSVDGV